MVHLPWAISLRIRCENSGFDAKCAYDRLRYSKLTYNFVICGHIRNANGLIS